MRLYHMPRSRSTRVLWMLEEIGAPFEITFVDRDAKQSDEHRQRHPLGRVPAIEEDGGFVFESAAICLHLADLHAEAGLIAAPGTHERALQYQWVVFAMAELEGALNAIAGQLWADGEPIQSVVDAARGQFATGADAVVQALGDDEFIVGGRFSVADVTLGAVLAFARVAELADLPPALGAYVDRLDARPARQRAIAVSAPVEI